MRSRPHRTYAMLSGFALLGASALAISQSSRAETGASAQGAPALIVSSVASSTAITASPNLEPTPNSNDLASAADAEALASRANDAEIECVAKVVHREAANQSRRGQLAVAQVMINRSRSGRFPASLCDVAKQPGQFFNVDRYDGRKDKKRWEIALEVAREAVAGTAEDPTGGAYFYHADYVAPSRFFRSRERVAQIEDHIFYR